MQRERQLLVEPDNTGGTTTHSGWQSRQNIAGAIPFWAARISRRERYRWRSVGGSAGIKARCSPASSFLGRQDRRSFFGHCRRDGRGPKWRRGLLLSEELGTRRLDGGAVGRFVLGNRVLSVEDQR